MRAFTIGLTSGLAIAGVVAAALAFAQTTGHEGHTMSTTMSDDPATQAFMDANAVMHTDMAIEYTGNPDADFVRGMIPHHQGAVDMAKIVLEYGSDPEVRAFAEAVIAAQSTEIDFMKGWLAAKGL